MKYFLLAFSTLCGLLIVVVHVVPFVYLRKLVKPFLIIMFLLLCALTVRFLSIGIVAASLWFIVIPLFIYTVFPDEKIIRWLLWYSCTVVLTLVLGITLFGYNNDVLADEPSYIMWENMLNLVAAFLFSIHSLYYINFFHKQKINQLEYLAGMRNDEKVQRLLEVNYDEQYKFLKIYEKIVEYIESEQPYLHSNFKIAKISNELNINSMYIYKAISLQKNMNFNNYINSYRIAHAKKMIQNNLKYTLEHIYLSSGFNNQSSFNRIFKTEVGITPSEYRNQFLEKTE